MLAITEIYHLLNTIDFDKKSKKRQENKKASNVFVYILNPIKLKCNYTKCFYFRTYKAGFTKEILN